MSTEKMPSYGGQALIEGVVMRGTNAVAAAMRAPDGRIEIVQEDLSGIYKSPIRKIPFLRGLVILWDALGLGVRFLTLSANIQTGEDEKLEGSQLALTLITSFAIAIGFFFLLPALAAQGMERFLGITSWWSNLLEGIIRLIFMIAYIWGIGRMEEIKRVFAYHGAEHKTINAYENGVDLTPEKVSQCSLQHPRCGTSFLLTVMVFSIILFSALGPLSLFWRLITRVVLIPVLAGFAYEYIRWTANHLESPLVKILVKPNLALQNLTTREPDLSMLEVSITAFKTMLAKEENKVQEPAVAD